MNKQNIFSIVGASLFEDSFIPVIELKKNKEKIKKELGTSSLRSYEEILDVSKFLEEDISCLHMIKNNPLDLYCYLDLDLGLLVSLLDGKMDTIKNFNIKSKIEVQKRYLERALDEGDYYSYFSMVDYKLRIFMLNKKFELVPEEIKYDLFKTVYSSLDYGFEYIKKSVYEEVKALKPKDVEKKLEEKLDKNGMLIIYRGATDNSVSINDSNSWTTSLSVAAKFATRFNCPTPVVYRAKVKREDIIAYIKDRKEEEIVVMPKDIKFMEEMELATMGSLFENYLFTISEIASISQNISADLHIPRRMKRLGVHSTGHFKRVLFHSLIISEIESLDNIEKNILIEASRYHDIGRGNDAICYEHGIKSYKIIEKTNVLEKYTEDEKETIRYVMENHCIPDKEFIPIEKYRIKNKYRAKKLLKIFKDSDGLDRVRIRDLDTNYLRTDSARNLVLVAYQLLEYGL